jgi:hypothetical protein
VAAGAVRVAVAAVVIVAVAAVVIVVVAVVVAVHVVVVVVVVAGLMAVRAVGCAGIAGREQVVGGHAQRCSRSRRSRRAVSRRTSATRSLSLGRWTISSLMASGS